MADAIHHTTTRRQPPRQRQRQRQPQRPPPPQRQRQRTASLRDPARGERARPMRTALSGWRDERSEQACRERWCEDSGGGRLRASLEESRERSVRATTATQRAHMSVVRAVLVPLSADKGTRLPGRDPAGCREQKVQPTGRSSISRSADRPVPSPDQTASNSTSNSSVACGGITPPAPYRAVAQFRRNDEEAGPPDLHPLDAFIPALDDFPQRRGGSGTDPADPWTSRTSDRAARPCRATRCNGQ